MASSEPGWLTTAQAGKRLGVGPWVVVKWIRVGRLKGHREKDRWRVDSASVEEEVQRVARAGWWRRVDMPPGRAEGIQQSDRKSTRLNSSHVEISYAVFCLKKKNTTKELLIAGFGCNPVT